MHAGSTSPGVGHDFANAVLYSLSDHPKSTRDRRGIVLPINGDVWQQVFKQMFRERYKDKEMQNLAAYCGYFRRGEHGIGYDKEGRRDFGRGARVKIKNKGLVGLRIAEDPNRAVWPGKNSRLQSQDVIHLAMAYWEANHPEGDASASAHFLGPQNGGEDADDLAEEIIRDPIRREMLIEAFERKASWARLARKLYGYTCMIPGCRFELIKDDGELYIEVHHIIAMCDGGSPNDKMNLSVLCPNLHREIHFATARRRKMLTVVIKREQARRLAGATA